MTTVSMKKPLSETSLTFTIIEMALPFFYVEGSVATGTHIVLPEDTSRHIVQVLRMQNGEKIHLTDGKGSLAVAVITDNHKKKCTVQIASTTFHQPPVKKITVGISLLKNASRFEWFLEKATEIGVQEIFPLLCHRTEKQHFRFDRMNQILISAMLQSQQVWLPVLHQPLALDALWKKPLPEKKLIAHCEPTDKIPLTSISENEALVLIGPEGDFTTDEIEDAIAHQCVPVHLGTSRLRTETAGMVAAAFLCNL